MSRKDKIPQAYDAGLYIYGPGTGVAAEIIDRVVEHAHEIWVRDVKDGKVGNYRLIELPADQILAHIIRWVRERQQA